MNKLSNFICCVYNELTHSSGYEASAVLVCELFCEHTQASVLVLEEGTTKPPLFNTSGANKPIGNLQDAKFVYGLAVAAAAIPQAQTNISLAGMMEGEHSGSAAMVVPIYADRVRLGSFIAISKREFSHEELTMGKMAGSLLAANLYALKNENEAVAVKDASAVRAAIGTLSYSELEAATEVFNRLNQDEGNIVASAIAAESNGKVTRSAIVNALRKLESAGLLESHSMGVKGTFIKIKTPALREGLRKMIR